MASDPQCYPIVGGVRRCVAANLAGLAAVIAEVYDDNGRHVLTGLVELACIFSAVTDLSRVEPGRNFDDLVGAMVRVAGRAAFVREPPVVTLLAFNYATYYTAVADVIVINAGGSSDDD